MKTYPSRVSLIALAIAQEEGYFTSLSLARRYKNPGNLRVVDQHGKPNRDRAHMLYGSDVQLDLNGFVQFPSAERGYTALLDDIQANSSATLGAFLKRYAPPSENHTDFYIALVSSLTGIPVGETIGAKVDA